MDEQVKDEIKDIRKYSVNNIFIIDMTCESDIFENDSTLMNVEVKRYVDFLKTMERVAASYANENELKVVENIKGVNPNNIIFLMRVILKYPNSVYDDDIRSVVILASLVMTSFFIREGKYSKIITEEFPDYLRRQSLEFEEKCNSTYKEIFNSNILPSQRNSFFIAYVMYMEMIGKPVIPLRNIGVPYDSAFGDVFDSLYSIRDAIRNSDISQIKEVNILLVEIEKLYVIRWQIYNALANMRDTLQTKYNGKYLYIVGNPRILKKETIIEPSKVKYSRLNEKFPFKNSEVNMYEYICIILDINEGQLTFEEFESLIDLFYLV